VASNEAWALLEEFRSQWIGRKREPTDEDLAEFIDRVLEARNDDDFFEPEDC
jgi:hypothetical protein